MRHVGELAALMLGLGCAPTQHATDLPMPAEPTSNEDADADGIAGANDQCPTQPEDVDGEADEDGCPDLLARLDACEVTLLEPVYFEFDESKVDPRSDRLLDDVVIVMRMEPTLTVRIEGHTDSKGSDAYNLELSQRRVENVGLALVDRGISPARLTVHGFGETQPVDSNQYAEGRANNRRVVIRRTDVKCR